MVLENTGHSPSPETWLKEKTHLTAVWEMKSTDFRSKEAILKYLAVLAKERNGRCILISIGILLLH